MSESELPVIERADIVIGLVPASKDAQTLASAIGRILEFTPPLDAVLVHPPFSADGVQLPEISPRWRLLANPQLAQDPSSLAQSMGDSYRSVFELSRRWGAGACAMIASDLSAVTSDWVPRLLQPAVEENFDLVAPCYARHPFEGLINRAVVYPLVRALYGKRVRNPWGPDFGIGTAMLERFAAASGGAAGRMHPVASLTAQAAIHGMKICQSHLGPRVYAAPDWTSLSSLLAQILGPLFLDVERYAPHWQRTRGSQPVPEFGEPMFVAGPESAVDVTRLIESFQLGARNLTEIWSIILPPSTLVELRRLARQDSGDFRMPDETWARIVYDFAIAYHVRGMSRDQILRAITPVYLGWVASYALQLGGLAPEAVEQKLENLCLAYENTKSYLVSRWRWPDRFNP